MVKPRSTLAGVPYCIHGSMNKQELMGKGIDPSEVVDFSASLNPYGPPEFIFDGLKNSFADIHTYPDSESPALKKAISKVTGCPEENILVTNGITEFIHLIALAFIENSTVLIPRHTYGEYEVSARIMNANIKHLKMPGLRIVPELVCESLPYEGVMFLCNPNNPTGQYLKENELKTIVDAAVDKNALLVIDEAYIDFVEGAFNSVELVRTCENVIIMRSLTKSYTIPGIRIGYGMASEDIIRSLRCVQLPWSVSTTAQNAGVEALQDFRFLRESKAKILAEKERLEAILDVHPSDANYFILEVGEAKEARTKLLEHAVLVRDCTSFGLPGYIRFSVRKPAENDRLVHGISCLGHREG